MKNTLLALALFAFAGTTAFATTGPGKDGAKGKKEECAMKGSMAGGSCCMKKDGKTASAKPAEKAPAAVVKM